MDKHISVCDEIIHPNPNYYGGSNPSNLQLIDDLSRPSIDIAVTQGRHSNISSYSDTWNHYTKLYKLPILYDYRVCVCVGGGGDKQMSMYLLYWWRECFVRVELGSEFEW